MKKEIFEAQHLVEAKEEAFKKMNMKEEDLIIRICDKSEKENPDMCVIEVYQKDELTQKIKDFLIDIISDMGVNCNIETKTRNDLFYLNILSNKNEVLIGKSGVVLDAIQTLVNEVVRTNIKMNYKIVIDVADYKLAKQKRIEHIAKMAAKSVGKTKIEVSLDPMNSYARRIVHNTLANSRDVYTESYGEEPNRYVVIKPKKLK